MRLVRLGLLVLVSGFVLTGCYFQSEVQSSEVGLVMPDGVKVDEVVGPGRYTDLGFYSDLKTLDVSAKTSTWTDPELVTRDKQPIGLTLQITYARGRVDAAVRNMWDNYRIQATSDEALTELVLSRVPDAAKQITTRYTLSELLGTEGNDQAGRSLLKNGITEMLGPQVEEFGSVLLDVSITNVAPDTTYINLLKEKANVSLQQEIAQQRTSQLQEQLKQEQAQTEIDLEIGRRQNAVAEEKAQVYQMSDEAYELERLRLLADIMGDKSTVYFVQPGTDLTLLFSGGQAPAVLPGDNTGTIVVPDPTTTEQP